MGDDALQSLLLISLRAGLYTCFCSFLFQFPKKNGISIVVECFITRWGGQEGEE